LHAVFNKIYLYYENERFTYAFYMVRNRVDTIKIMLNRRNNELTNIKIRKRFGEKNKNRHVLTCANKSPGYLESFLSVLD